MHLKATWLAPVALAAAAVAGDEPCAQITQLVADANQSKSMRLTRSRLENAADSHSQR